MEDDIFGKLRAFEINGRYDQIRSFHKALDLHKARALSTKLEQVHELLYSISRNISHYHDC